MAFTDVQMADVREWIQWDPPTDADLDAAHDQLGGGIMRVVVKALDKRYVAMVVNPAQFSVAGEYSQNTAENIKAMAALLTRARGLLVIEDAALAGESAMARLVRRDPVRDACP